MNDIPNNSHKFRSSLGDGQPSNDIQPVRERPRPILDAGDMIVDKPSVVRRIFDSVITNDLETAKHDILYDVVLPSVTDGVYNILQSALAIMFGRRYMPSGSRTNYNSITKGNSYSSYYQKPANQDDEDNIYRFKTRMKADEVLSELRVLRERYPFVKVADIYDLSSKTPPVTSFNWGWYDISQARIIRDNRDGSYILQMPKPRPLD